jgi:hypothetical protein
VPFQILLEEKEEIPELLIYMDIFIFLLKYKIGLILNVKNKLLNIKKKNIIAFKNFARNYSYDQDRRVFESE